MRPDPALRAEVVASRLWGGSGRRIAKPVCDDVAPCSGTKYYVLNENIQTRAAWDVPEMRAVRVTMKVNGAFLLMIPSGHGLMIPI